MAAKLAEAMEREIAGDESGGIRDLDLVALATVADLVPLTARTGSWSGAGSRRFAAHPVPACWR